jgi:hypothetical protein
MSQPTTIFKFRIPAKAGKQFDQSKLDARLRGHDDRSADQPQI